MGGVDGCGGGGGLVHPRDRVEGGFTYGVVCGVPCRGCEGVHG